MFRFLEPHWLPLVVLPFVAAFLIERSRVRAAVLFAGEEFLEDLTVRPRGLRLRRALVLLACSLFLLTVSEPRLASSVQQRRANVVLVMDVSGSMSAEDVAPTRLAVAKSAATAFVENLPSG